jgi:glycosyltransferase involved in cell wall biosynthesis
VVRTDNSAFFQTDTRWRGEHVKILHFVTGGFSGATQVAIDLCKAAASAPDVQVKLVLRKKRNTSLARINALRAQNIDVEVVPGWAHMATILALKNVCDRWQPDILVAHGFSEHIWGRLAGLWAGTPHLIHVEHNSRERYTRWRLFLSKWLAKHTDAIVGVSEGVKTNLLALGFPPEKCHAIPNGIDWNRFEALTIPPWPLRKSAVIMASRFARQKDPLTLIAAIGLLNQRELRVPLAFAGVGKKTVLNRSQRASAALDLSKEIEFLGHVNCLPQLMTRYQIFALSTHYEGMPLALIEAMACGCACIGTDVVGVREVLEHGKTGLLVPEGDAQALAQAIAWLVSHPEQAEAMGKAARELAKTHYTAHLMQTRYLNLLRALPVTP